MNIRLDNAGQPARFQRRDAGELARPVRTPEGFLQVEGVLARPCILHYPVAGGGVRHELLLPVHLFNAESMRSFAVLALTDTHPEQLLTPDTVKEHQIGSIGEPRADGDRLVSLLGILAASAIRSVENGRAELSCGYSCGMDETPGIHPTLRCPTCGSGEYDAIQIDRRGNHVALCDSARAGAAARIRLDSDGNAEIVAPQHESAHAGIATQQTNSETPRMPHTIRIDGLTLSVDDTNLPSLQTRIDSLAGKADQEKARADAAETARKDAVAKFDAAVARLDAFKARILFNLKRRADAMKARMVGCDECNGAGKVMDAEGAAEVKCDYCDGTGKIRMHDAIKALPPAPGAEDVMVEDEATPEHIIAEAAEEKQPAAQEAAEHGMDPAKLKQVQQEKADARKRKSDSLGRMVDRRAAARGSLLAEAAKHLDGADGLAKKPDLEIKREVLKKLAPHLDAAKLDSSVVGVLYTAEIARVAANGGGPSDALRAGLLPAGPAAPPAARADSRKTLDQAKDAAAAQTDWNHPNHPSRRRQ